MRTTVSAGNTHLQNFGHFHQEPHMEASVLRTGGGAQCRKITDLMYKNQDK